MHRAQEWPVQLGRDPDQTPGVSDDPCLLQLIDPEVPGPVLVDEAVDGRCAQLLDRGGVPQSDRIERLGNELLLGTEVVDERVGRRAEARGQRTQRRLMDAVLQQIRDDVV